MENKPMTKAPTSRMKRRMMFVAVMLTVVGTLVLVVRLAILQFVHGEEYRQRAASQQLRTTEIAANRGSIYDRNGKTLAQSASVWNVFLSPADISDEDAPIIAEGLAEILDLDEADILAKTENKSSYYVKIKSKIEKPVKDEITQFISDNGVRGINLEEDTKRYYPYGSLASTVLGFTNNDNQGAYGLEAYYNETLSGTPGRVVSAKNALGTDMPYSYEKMYEAQDGNSLVLTIDEAVQHYLENHLETAIIEHDIQNRACGIVMNCKTGEILAMATKPDFDPNEPLVIADPNVQAELDQLEGDEYTAALQEAQYDQWRNKAISDPYEPGSVFKIIHSALALEEQAVSVDDSFYCSGSLQVGPETYHCWKLAGHGAETFAQGVMNSCNPVFIMVGQRVGADNFYKYFKSFGLTEKTGIDLPGEAGNAGLYHTLENLQNPSGVYLASESFGQTFKVTPIQLITAVSAAINGGKLITPHLVKQVLDSDGNVLETYEPQVQRQVVSEEVSKTVAMLCEKVVSEGTGKQAQVPGYLVGGKTGTSQKIDIRDENEAEKYIVSFLGFAPADDPEIVVLVMLDEPYLSNPSAAAIAAPVVGAVLADVLPYVGIEPNYTEEELANVEVNVPYLINSMISDAETNLRLKGLKTRIYGEGKKVVRQVPGAGSPIPKGGTVILYTDETTPEETTIVPNVVGMTGIQANTALLNAGLNVKFTGVDINANAVQVKSQSYGDGEEVPLGTVVTVELITTEQLE